ncbi:guanylate kinase [Clostridium sp. AM48-13]|uniref:guanylate kinase n=1 Tax=Clostridium sp. AM48-13 TaxID=2293034 RepID=UPI000E54CC40|nr:guanylate kinase [Clostridium sp. AM48-13]RHV70592.1 guanylate kinase [Clostridium sp. OF13-4]
MGHIFYVMGKSASGKDTIYKILRERLPQIRTVVPYTTRPIRAGERDGVEYYFVTGKRLADLEKQGKIIEKRTYQTVYGPWSYATVDDGQIDLGSHDYFMIGTLESYEGTRNYFGADVLVPLYIEVEDGERLQRALDRERQQTEPKYAELCRRFLADEADFSAENMEKCGIRAENRFENRELEACVDTLVREIGLRDWHFWNRKCRKKTWWQQEFAVFKCEATANSVTGHVCVNSNKFGISSY